MKRVDKKAFGQRVAQRRQALKLSQGALAQLIGMKQQGVVSIEQGDVSRPRLLRELAVALKTTEQWLLWREGDAAVAPAPADLVNVPLLSWVSAGKLASAESQIPVEDVPLLAFADLGRGEFFALKVEGDSMDRVSPDGSVIVVNRAERDPLPGKPYVFFHRTEGTTYKLWHAEPDYLQPHSWNGAHQPIFIKRKKDLEVVGRVRRTLLDL